MRTSSPGVQRALVLALLVAFGAWLVGGSAAARPGGGQTYRAPSRSTSSSSSSRSYSSPSRSYSSGSSSSSRSSRSSSSSSSSSSGSSYSGSSSSTTVYVPSSTYSSNSGSGCNGFSWVILILIVTVLIYRYLKGRRANSGDGERAKIDVDTTQAQAGIEALRKHDEGFDPQAFVERTRAVAAKVNEAWLAGSMGASRRVISDGVYTRFMTQLQLLKADGLRNVMADWRIVSADILAAEADENWDTVHVRIVGAARDMNVQIGQSDADVKKQVGRAKLDEYHEVWSFIRRRGKKSKKGVPALEGQCPNCGAPLPLGDVVTCDHCQALINSGEHDWVLAEITQPEEWRPRAATEEIAGLAALRTREATLSRQELEDRASVIFWKWVEARTAGKADKLARFCVKSPADAQVAAELLMTPAKLRDVAVGSADLKRVEPSATGQAGTLDRAVVEIRYSAAVDGGESDFDILEFVLARQADAPQHAKFKRGLCSLDCPECAGQLATSDATTCTSCGATLGGGKQEWALLAVRKGSLPPDEGADGDGDDDGDGGHDDGGPSKLETGLAIGAIVAGVAEIALEASSSSSDNE